MAAWVAAVREAAEAMALVVAATAVMERAAVARAVPTVAEEASLEIQLEQRAGAVVVAVKAEGAEMVLAAWVTAATVAATAVPPAARRG